MKKNSQKTKLFSLLLSAVLLISTLNGSAFAVQTTENDLLATEASALTGTGKDGIINLSKGELPLSELKNRQLPSEDKPEAVSAQSIERNGHVNRLRAQEESLNEIIFQNRDGTKTLYMFSENVKYIDDNGLV